MTANYLLLLLVCLSSALLAIRVMRLPKNYNRGWLAVSIAILAIAAAAFVWLPNWAGWIAGGLWFALVLLPLLLYKRIEVLLAREGYRRARRLATWLRWLHPMDGWWQHPTLLQAIELGNQGDLAQANQLLDRYQTVRTPISRAARAFIYRVGAQWLEMRLWLETNFSSKTMLEDPVLLMFYLRSLGETGDLNRLLAHAESAMTALAEMEQTTSQTLLRLFVLAFSGYPEAVERLFRGPLSTYSLPVQKFWLATAEMAAGNRRAARKQLRSLQDIPNLALQNAIAWRLAHPLQKRDRVLTDAAQQQLLQFSQSLQPVPPSRPVSFFSTTTYVTYGIIALNLGYFAISSFIGSSENPDTLDYLGALVPAAVWQGEWRRLLQAMFLHYGWVHLTMNMLGLYFLGNFVEVALGRVRYLLVYFISGLGSMLVVTLLAVLAYQFLPGLLETSPSFLTPFLLTVAKRVNPGQIVVGASGAIMGLVGAISVILLKDWLRVRSRLATKRLQTILLIIALQTLFDLVTPHVSAESHFSGLILGFVTTAILLLVPWPKRLRVR